LKLSSLELSAAVQALELEQSINRDMEAMVVVLESERSAQDAVGSEVVSQLSSEVERLRQELSALQSEAKGEGEAGVSSSHPALYTDAGSNTGGDGGVLADRREAGAFPVPLAIRFEASKMESEERLEQLQRSALTRMRAFYWRSAVVEACGRALGGWRLAKVTDETRCEREETARMVGLLESKDGHVRKTAVRILHHALNHINHREASGCLRRWKSRERRTHSESLIENQRVLEQTAKEANRAAKAAAKKAAKSDAASIISREGAEESRTVAQLATETKKAAEAQSLQVAEGALKAEKHPVITIYGRITLDSTPVIQAEKHAKEQAAQAIKEADQSAKAIEKEATKSAKLAEKRIKAAEREVSTAVRKAAKEEEERVAAENAAEAAKRAQVAAEVKTVRLEHENRLREAEAALAIAERQQHDARLVNKARAALSKI